MTIVRVKGIKRYRDPKTGRWYCYHRKSGTRIEAEFGTPAFFAELDAIDRAHVRKEPKPGTLGMIITSYRGAPGFRDLAPATREGYGRMLNILKPLDDMPLVELTPGFVAQLRDNLADDRGRRTSGFVLAVLSNVCEHAREREWMRDNPVRGVRKLRRPKDEPKRNRPWTLEERRAVLTAAKPYERVPLALAMFLGLRLGDVARFPRNGIQNGVARLLTGKTGQDIVLPVHSDLAAILAAAPRHDATTLAAVSRGTPWSTSGIQTMIHRLTTKLEGEGVVGPGLTFHGLRHTCGTLLAEAGADLDTIRRWLGQATLQMAQHYSEQADRSKEARGVLKKLDVLGTKVSRRRDKGV